MKPYISGHKIRVGGEVSEAWRQLFSPVECSNCLGEGELWDEYDDLVNCPKCDSDGIIESNQMTFRFSTSIQNFADRVKLKHDEYIWSFNKSLFDPTAFIGLYHEGDWLRAIIHRGPKLFFWCGGDILRLQKKPFWQWLIRQVEADHVCENEVEWHALKNMGIHSRIHPILFFDDWEKYPLSYTAPVTNAHVWLTCHPGREREYGVELVEEIADLVPEVNFHIFGIAKSFHDTWFDPIDGEMHNYRQSSQPNIYYHGQVPSEKLDKMIRGYHAGLRTCEFDGCPHTVTKGVLLGQWPINRIPYPHTDSYETKEELIKLLKGLKNKKKPNLVGRKHWLKTVSEFPWQ